jgi:putative membrane protein insertion efficiency factor
MAGIWSLSYTQETMITRNGNDSGLPSSNGLAYKGNPFTAILKSLFLGLIWLYRKIISPHTPQSCRFYPSCSCYSRDAIKRYGPFKGVALAAKRISRCHPRNPGGYDPVP